MFGQALSDGFLLQSAASENGQRREEIGNAQREKEPERKIKEQRRFSSAQVLVPTFFV